MRIVTLLGALAIVLLTFPSSVQASCSQSDVAPSQTGPHSYRLVVTSASAEPVDIVGSVAFSGKPDGFWPIEGKTPYELFVEAHGILLIVKAKDVQHRINFSLSVDGQELTVGRDDEMYSAIHNLTGRGKLTTMNFQLSDDDTK